MGRNKIDPEKLKKQISLTIEKEKINFMKKHNLNQNLIFERGYQLEMKEKFPNELRH